MASSSSSLLKLVLLVAVTAILASSRTAAVRAAGGEGGSGEPTTHIRLYIHERFSGANATVASPVLRSPLGDNATFGEVGVIDDELRAGVRRSSELVGRYQGFFVGTDLAAPSYLSAVTLVFTAGECRGSTLTVQGQFSFDDAADALERAVVGGTGAFRMAHGYSVMRVVSTPTPETAVFRIDVFVVVPRRGQFY